MKQIKPSLADTEDENTSHRTEQIIIKDEDKKRVSASGRGFIWSAVICNCANWEQIPTYNLTDL